MTIMNNINNAQEIQPLSEEGSKPKILVVDDSRLVRETVRKLLSAEFDVLEAVDGEDGWDVILQNPDLKVVLTDAGMPKLDGYELIIRVRAHSDAIVSKLPMIMITGAEEGQTELRERALDLGASDFIIKPFDKVQMIARMRSYVKQDELQRELKTTEHTLATHATIDTLTKLNNLRYLLKRASQELALAHRHQSDLSFLGIRIDNTQKIIEKYGKKTFEKIILWSVKRLEPLLRKEDVLTHTDLGEFIIVAPLTNRLSSAIFCDRIRRDILKDTFSETVLALPVTVSMSLVNNVSDTLETAESCLEILRARLDAAQSRGGNRIIASNVSVRINTPKEVIPEFDTREALKSLTTLVNHQGNIDLSNLANKLLPLLQHIDTELKLDLQEQVKSFREKLLLHNQKHKTL